MVKIIEVNFDIASINYRKKQLITIINEQKFHFNDEKI